MVKLVIITTVLLMAGLAFAEISPSPSPVSPPVLAPTPETESPPSPVSPSPAESPIVHSPAISPEIPGGSSSRSPSPATKHEGESDFIHETTLHGGGGGGKMSAGKKAGIVVGVLAAVCVVGFAGAVYKKRRENIRRSKYQYSATAGHYHR